MLFDVEFLRHVVVPKKDMTVNGTIPTSLVVTYLLKQLACCKALEDVGYILGVTKLKAIGNGEHYKSSKFIAFPAAFNCRTLLPIKGEIMNGMVHSVSRYGVFLNSGPMKMIYLSVKKMPNYHYVDKGNPLFLTNDFSRIEKDVVVRFVVFGTRWNPETRDIRVLASLEGDSLGPVSMAGFDGFEL